MAAQGYYNDAHSNPPAYDHHEPPSESFNRVSPSPRPSPSPVGYNHNAAPYYQSPDDLHDPHHLRYSQQSIGSDSGAYVAGGRINDNDQYAENIPLKSANPYDNQPPYDHQPPGQPWMQQPTHYAPDPVMMETQTHPPQKKKKGFFKKKIAFVTYILTAAQIIVFIVELVKAGKSFAGIIDRLGLTKFNSTTYWDTSPNETAIQPDDRAIAIRPNQHGCEICPLHEEHPSCPEQYQSQWVFLSLSEYNK